MPHLPKTEQMIIFVKDVALSILTIYRPLNHEKLMNQSGWKLYSRTETQVNRKKDSRQTDWLKIDRQKDRQTDRHTIIGLLFFVQVQKNT